MQKNMPSCALTCQRPDAHLAYDMLDSAPSDASGPIGEGNAEVVEAVTMEDIDHQEPAAVVSEGEAADVCQVQWAGYIERLARDPAAAGSDGSGQPEVQQQVKSSDHASW